MPYVGWHGVFACPLGRIAYCDANEQGLDKEMHCSLWAKTVVSGSELYGVAVDGDSSGSVESGGSGGRGGSSSSDESGWCTLKE